MSILIDARGRSCPEPVIMTKDALESSEGETIEVITNSKTATDNIERYVKKEGYSVDISEDGDDYILIIKR